MNIKRMARTNERMCIPELPGDLFLAAVKAVIEADRDWIPSAPGTAMYIRPFIFGDEVSFSVLPAKHYKFMIILSPTGSYYAANDGGLATTRIYVQDKYIRAAHGGTGYAKVGGNYGGGMRASQDAMKYNCKDVRGLDAAELSMIEEIGTSNAFSHRGRSYTAPLRFRHGPARPHARFCSPAAEKVGREGLGAEALDRRGRCRVEGRQPAGNLRQRHRSGHLADRLAKCDGHGCSGRGWDGRSCGAEAL